MPRGNSGRVKVRVFGACCGYVQSRCAKPGRIASANRGVDGSDRTTAEKTDCCLLVATKSQCRSEIRHACVYHATVVAPGECQPGAVCAELILRVGCLLEGLILINTEGSVALLICEKETTDRRSEEASANVSKGAEGIEPTVAGKCDSDAHTVGFGLSPLSGKYQGSI